MKFLASILLALAKVLDPARDFAALKERHTRLERQHTELVVETYSDAMDPRFDVAPELSPDDRATLATFLKTPSGQALNKRFGVVAMNQALLGCNDPMHTTYAAGNGNGWNEAYKWFQTISRVPRVEDTKNDEQAPEGEEQLLERMSP